MQSAALGIILRARTIAVAAALLSAGACVFRSVETRDLPKTVPTVVSTPVKVHLLDGSTVIYAAGAEIGNGRISGGGGVRHDIAGRSATALSVPLDSVVGVETFKDKINMPATVLGSATALAAGVMGTAGLAVVLFGSCPTFYSDSANTLVLQGEGFSYAIAPLFEHRDIDRLRMTTGPDGILQLQVRNEALETHYINHLEVLEVRHTSDQAAISDEKGRAVLLRNLRTPAAVTDRAGRNVLAEVSAHDGLLFSSDPSLVASRTSADLSDYLDFSISAPARTDSVAVVLRLRNSLLNTVLLYEEVLAASGARSLDWMGRDLDRISTALELGRWYTEKMGMSVQVRGDAGYRQITKIADTGPIAYHDVVVLVPMSAAGTADVRLSFVADNWRVESIAYATDFERTESRVLALAGVTSGDGSTHADAMRSLASADDRYLQTTPGQSFSITFDAGRASARVNRTFFLAAQGYYVEWMRAEWLEQPRTREPFAPSDERLLAALKSWAGQRDAFEQRFYSSKIPVR